MKRNTQTASESSSRPAGSVESVTSTGKSWISPRVTDLPRLNEITLQSGGIPGGGGTGGGGSTVVP